MKYSYKTVMPHLALLAVALIYGANYTIAKELLVAQFISPNGLVLFRVLIAAMMFLLIHVFFVKERIDRKDWLLLASCSLFGVVINQIFFIAGLKYTTPINAAVLMVTTPILVLVISAMFYREKLNLIKSVGIVLGAGGTLMLLMNKGSFSFSGNLKGDIFIIINAISYAMYLVMIKPLMHKYSPFTIMKWIFIFGLIPVIPIGVEDAITAQWASFTPGMWLAFFYVLIFTTVFAYWLNAIALKMVEPATVGVYIYLQPVMATTIALLAGKDSLTIEKLIPGLMIIAGVYLVSFRKKTRTV
ncbi:MAG TPA: EamA/RhaT family transporter [Saprospirales bacterium]|nr:EamA/RhaT family transporter [Saprospirales bacterium]HRQ31110.1 DMT family transporter [Saprospiraceae bacterium]